jgi:hypothetical protein
MKKLTGFLIAVCSIGLVVAVILLLYYRTRQQPPLITTGIDVGDEYQNNTNTSGDLVDATNTTNSSSSENKEEEEDFFGPVTEEPVLDFFAYTKNSVVAVRTDGAIFKIEKNQIAFLSSSKIQNIISTSFSYDGQKIMVLFGEKENPQVSIFDVAKKSWESVTEPGIVSAAWSPNTYQITYLKKQEKTAIVVRDTKNIGSKPQVIATLPLQDVTIEWPASSIVRISEKPSGYTKTNSWIFDIKSKKIQPLEQDQFGLVITTNSPLSQYLKLTVDPITSKNGQLSLVDMLSNTEKNLSFLTVPEKCSFAQIQKDKNATGTEELLLCGIPENKDDITRAVLPDSYYKKSLFTIDTITAINPKTGEITPLVTNEKDFDAIKITVTDNRVFFINRYDKKIYRTPI